MGQILELLQGLPIDISNIYIALLRIIAPVLMGVILWRSGRPLLSFKKEPEIWAVLRMADGTAKPVTHWENIIGSHPKSDLVIPLGTISRNHAVLTRYDDGSWTISDTDSKNGVKVNGQSVSICAIEPEDVIDLGGLTMQLEPITPELEQHIINSRTKASSGLSSLLNVLLLTLFQGLCCLAFLLNGKPEHAMDILTGFGGICAAQWLVLAFYACIRRSAFEVETIAFFLCPMGLHVIAATVPGEAVKQLIALGLGLAVFFGVGWSLRDLDRAKAVRYGATVAGILLLVITLLFGREIYGAKNWLVIGGFPSSPRS